MNSLIDQSKINLYSRYEIYTKKSGEWDNISSARFLLCISHTENKNWFCFGQLVDSFISSYSTSRILRCCSDSTCAEEDLPCHRAIPSSPGTNSSPTIPFVYRVPVGFARYSRDTERTAAIIFQKLTCCPIVMGFWSIVIELCPIIVCTCCSIMMDICPIVSVSCPIMLETLP